MEAEDVGRAAPVHDERHQPLGVDDRCWRALRHVGEGRDPDHDPAAHLHGALHARRLQVPGAAGVEGSVEVCGRVVIRVSTVCRVRGSRGGPRSWNGIPIDRWAAAGANTSRPWNVADTGPSSTPSEVISAAWPAPPSVAQAIDSTPLSGKTNSAPDLQATATGRRADPTPGSTTPRYTASSGMNGAARPSAMAPATTSCRGMAWVRSITLALGAMRATTPWQIPTNSSARP